MKCIFFVFDEPESYVFKKMACAKSRVSLWQYFNEKSCTDKDMRKVRQAEEWLEEKLHAKTAKSRIVDKVDSLAKLLLFVAEAKASYGLDAIFIDNVYYLKNFANEDIHHVIYILKELAVRLDIAILITAHLIRGNKNSPITHQIKNKFILRTADKIMILNRPEAIATAKDIENGHVIKGAVELNIIKNYTGACGFIDLKFDGSTLRFYEPEKHDFEKYDYGE